jgi:hypothetical protein
MPFATKLTPEQWAEARRLREGGATLVAVAERFGVTPGTISQRGRKEGWTSPVATRARTTAALPVRKAKVLALSPAAAGIRRRLILRVYNIMDLKLELMELRMHQRVKQARAAAQSTDEPIPAGDDESEQRQLDTYIKTIEQTTELDPDRVRHVNGGAATADAEARASEADAFRREIAQRIEKLIPPS